MCERAAKIWGIDADAVEWKDGAAVPGRSQCREVPADDAWPRSRPCRPRPAAPIAGHHEVNADGAGVSFGVHIVDVEVDTETGATKVLRYTVFQDAGKAVHPVYVEGQMQGGAVQGIGWALNEEYIYGDDGRLQNPGFLDYRVPVASDLPMIDTVILEIPNPGHPYGVRGVGETAIVPPLAAISNAVSRCRRRPADRTADVAAARPEGACPRRAEMVKVRLWGSLRQAADGQTEVEVEARNFKELLDRLAETYPGLEPQIRRGVSLSLDGVIYREAWFTEIRPDSEVVLMPYMTGG